MLIAIFAVGALSAQTPRAVIKAVLGGDKAKAEEKFQKLNDKSKAQMPEMCALAEAVLLAESNESSSDRYRCYEIFSNNWDAIRSSTALFKLMKACDTSLDDLRLRLEQRSLTYVGAIDREQLWRDYLSLALVAGHSQIDYIEQRLMERVYKDCCEENSVLAYDRYLQLYPISEFSDDVVARRTLLLYNEAMTTTDESVVEKFTKDFPTYKDIANVEKRLMDMRYERVTTKGSLEDLQWFVTLYPDHEQREHIRQLMADKVYPTLEDNIAAFEQFIADYPNARQIEEAKYRLEVLKINLNKECKAIIAYLAKYGYDRNYPRFMRYLVEEHDILLLSSDFAELSLLRYRNSEGKEGYLTLDGEVAIEAKLDGSSEYMFPVDADINAKPHDFRRDRNLAIASLDGKWGVLKPNGEWLIKPEYLSAAFLDKEIVCAKSIEWGNSESESMKYACSSFDYEGATKSNDLNFYDDPGIPMFKSFDTKWFEADILIEPNSDGWTYCIYDANGVLISSTMSSLAQLTPDYKSFTSDDGVVYAINRKGQYQWFKFRSYTLRNIKDNILYGISTDGKYALVDLDANKIYYQNYKAMEPMSYGRIAVKYDDNSWGYLDSEFNPIVKGYKYASSYSCGAAVVFVDGAWHLIDTAGKSIGRSYDALWPLSDFPGLFCAGLEEKFGIIDSYGDVVVPLEYIPTNVAHNVLEGFTEYSVSIYDGVAHWGNGINTPLFTKREVAETSTTENTEVTVDTATEAPAEAPAEAVAETPAEAPTETPAEAPTEAPAEVVTEVVTEAVVETPAEVTAETPTQVVAEVTTEVVAETPTEVTTEVPTEVYTN